MRLKGREARLYSRKDDGSGGSKGQIGHFSSITGRSPFRPFKTFRPSAAQEGAVMGDLRPLFHVPPKT